MKNLKMLKTVFKEAKYDMAVGHLLLKSFWANENISLKMRVYCYQNL